MAPEQGLFLEDAAQVFKHFLGISITLSTFCATLNPIRLHKSPIALRHRRNQFRVQSVVPSPAIMPLPTPPFWDAATFCCQARLICYALHTLHLEIPQQTSSQ